MMKYYVDTEVFQVEERRIPQGYGNTANVLIKVVGIPKEESYSLEFLCPKNKKYVSEESVLNNDIINIPIPEKVFENIGEIYGQIIIKEDGNIVRKSLLSSEPIFVVEKSINAS